MGGSIDNPTAMERHSELVTSPFYIEGPALISFSGGRTSAYMLRRILDEGLQPDVHVVFANTGRERVETLDFVQACADRWNVPVRWVEYASGGLAEVDYVSAARYGGPFFDLVTKRGLPNPMARFCTQELKVRPMRDFMKGQGYEHWTNAVGIRADEPRRVARMRQPNRERWDVVLPLADAGVSERDVLAFWASQPFDLQLKSYEGNCDLCFLKTPHKRRLIIRDEPALALWWMEQEERTNSTFRRDTPSYAGLMQQVVEQPRLFDSDEDGDGLIDCLCTD